MNDTRSEQQTYYQVDPNNRDVHIQQRKDNSWLPLVLLLPLFFIGGWLANDATDNTTTQEQAASVAPSARFGVGGGPGEEISPLPEETEVPTEEAVATASPSPEAQMSPTPQATNTASPAATTTLERNGEESSI